MSEESPRLRMFAGPNGSGKSVLKTSQGNPVKTMHLTDDFLVREDPQAADLLAYLMTLK